MDLINVSLIEISESKSRQHFVIIPVDEFLTGRPKSEEIKLFVHIDNSNLNSCVTIGSDKEWPKVEDYFFYFINSIMIGLSIGNASI